MSAVIASIIGTAAGGDAPIVMWYYPGATGDYCSGCGVNDSYSYSFGIISGTNISWEIHYASSSGLCSSGYTIANSGTITGQAYYFQSYAFYTQGEGFYRVSASNSTSSFLSGWTKVSSVCCYYECGCYAYPGGPLGGWGCYDCSPTYECPACEYDCSCDNSFGYGTAGCNCDSEENACAWCWPSCPYGQTWCPTYETCPCGESCEPGYSQECNTLSYGYSYQPPGSC